MITAYPDYSDRMPRVLIPCRDETGKTRMRVALDMDALPPPEKLIDLLAGEVYPFEKWFDFARGYLAAGDEKSFEIFSTECLSPDIICELILLHFCLLSYHACHYAAEIQKLEGERPAYQEIQFHCGLAQLKIMLAKRENATGEKQRLFSQAGDHLMEVGT